MMAITACANVGAYSTILAASIPRASIKACTNVGNRVTNDSASMLSATIPAGNAADNACKPAENRLNPIPVAMSAALKTPNATENIRMNGEATESTVDSTAIPAKAVVSIRRDFPISAKLILPNNFNAPANAVKPTAATTKAIAPGSATIIAVSPTASTIKDPAIARRPLPISASESDPMILSAPPRTTSAADATNRAAAPGMPVDIAARPKANTTSDAAITPSACQMC